MNLNCGSHPALPANPGRCCVDTVATNDVAHPHSHSHSLMSTARPFGDWYNFADPMESVGRGGCNSHAHILSTSSSSTTSPQPTMPFFSSPMDPERPTPSTSSAMVWNYNMPGAKRLIDHDQMQLNAPAAPANYSNYFTHTHDHGGVPDTGPVTHEPTSSGIGSFVSADCHAQSYHHLTATAPAAIFHPMAATSTVVPETSGGHADANKCLPNHIYAGRLNNIADILWSRFPTCSGGNPETV